MIFNAFERLPKALLIFLLPAVLDLAAFVIGTLFFGFHGNSKIAFKLHLDVGIPSVSSLADQQNAVLVNAFGPNVFHASAFVLFWAIVFFLIHAFFQGGYIGLLKDCALGRTVTFQRFLEYGGRFFGRFILLEILVLAVTALAMFLLTGILRFLGMLIFLVLFFILRILFIYWEFTVVSDDLSVCEAFVRSRKYFQSRSNTVFAIIGTMLLNNAIFAFLVNAFWNPVPYVLFLLLYDYVASGIQLSLMLSLVGPRWK